MELGRSAWIRRDRLERIANAERDRRAGRTAIAIAAVGEAIEWPARAVLALALLPDGEGAHARRVLVEGLDLWAEESGLPSLDRPLPAEPEQSLVRVAEPAESDGEAVSDETDRSSFLELDRPIELGELERAFAEAEAQVDEMHDANRVAEQVLRDEPFALADLPEVDVADEDLDPLEASAREAIAVRPMDAATVPPAAGGSRVAAVRRDAPDEVQGRAPRAVVLATLERWLQNLERSRAGRLQ